MISLQMEMLKIMSKLVANVSCPTFFSKCILKNWHYFYKYKETLAVSVCHAGFTLCGPSK